MASERLDETGDEGKAEPDLPFDPSEHSHESVRKELAGIRDLDALERLLEAEREGMDRDGVEELIERKIDIVSDYREPGGGEADAESEPLESADSVRTLGEGSADPPGVMLVRHEVGAFGAGALLATILAGTLYEYVGAGATGNATTAVGGAVVLAATVGIAFVAADIEDDDQGWFGDLIVGGIAGAILGAVVGWVAFQGITLKEWATLLAVSGGLVGLIEGVEGLIGGVIFGAIGGAIAGAILQSGFVLGFVLGRPIHVVVLVVGAIVGVLALAVGPEDSGSIQRRSSYGIAGAILGGATAGGAQVVGVGPAIFFVGLPAFVGGTIPTSKLRERRRHEHERATQRIEEAEEMVTVDGEARAAISEAERYVESGRFDDAVELADRAWELAETENLIDQVTETLTEEIDPGEDAHELATEAREALQKDVEAATDATDRAIEAAVPLTESWWASAQRRHLELDEQDGPGLSAEEYDDIAEGYAEVVDTCERLIAVAEAIREWDSRIETDWHLGELNGDLEQTRTDLEAARTNRERARAEDLRSRAQTLVEDGDDALAGERFEQARDAYAEARDSYQQALEVTPGDHAEEFENAIQKLSTNVEQTEQLVDVEKRVRDAERNLDSEAYGAAIEEFEAAFESLESLSLDARELPQLYDRVQRGRIEARIGRAETDIEDAEARAEEGEHYAARQQFESVRESLEGKPLALANELGDQELIAEIGRLSERCERGAQTARQELFGDSAPESPTVPVGDVGNVRETVEAADVTGGELPEHEVIETIGSGGNADVHRVELEGGEEMALKVPRFQGTLSGEVVESFVDEAETWSKLADHDNVVTIEDWGTLPYPWILMEYADAGNLTARVGELGLAEAVELGADVADGIWHAHRHGVAHLDLKPENVLLATRDGREVPKVADWGLSKALLEHSGSVEGLTPQYAAPEQFRAEEYGGTDERTDVYQFGAVLYELLTGDPPFDGDQTSVMYDILETEPDPPTERDPTLPKTVDDLLLTALAKEKEERYESILYLRDELRDLAGEL